MKLFNEIYDYSYYQASNYANGIYRDIRTGYDGVRQAQTKAYNAPRYYRIDSYVKIRNYKADHEPFNKSADNTFKLFPFIVILLRQQYKYDQNPKTEPAQNSQ